MAGKPSFIPSWGRTNEMETAVALTNLISLEGKGRERLEVERDSGIEVWKEIGMEVERDGGIEVGRTIVLVERLY